MIGKILNGRYEILEEIGKGGMAYVYKARCVLLNRIVAVKILRDDLDGGDEFTERFYAEAHAAASLDHKNIVSIFDVGTDDNLHYITMEYVNGQTLKEYISSKQHLRYNEALDIAMQISDALTAAHHKNIVHRDIKPHNILITEEGVVKVTDFGIARFGTSQTLSTDNEILGSVHYISPEQAKGITVDNRSDIYSLGVVIYEMLSGRVPFDADNPVSVAMMQIENSPMDITEIVSNVPVSAQHIAFKAMSKDPDLRYQTAEELKLDIISVLKNPDVIIDKRFLYDNLNPEPETKVEPPKTDEPETKGYVRVIMIVLAAITSLVIVVGGYIFGGAFINNPKEFLSNLFTSASKEIEVPDLVGKTREEARKICDDLGLIYSEEDEIEDDSKLPGTIVSQTPSAKDKLFEDGTIKVVVTKSTSYIEMKDYAGRSYESVKIELENYGLVVNVLYKVSDADEGDVIEHSPKKGEMVKEGDLVTLYVSGTEPDKNDEKDKLVKVPYVKGKTYSEAVSLLKAAGLSVGEILGNPNPDSDDKVIEQSPPEGYVDKNSKIKLTFAKKEDDKEFDSEDNGENEDTQQDEKNSSNAQEQNNNETSTVKSNESNTSQNNQTNSSQPSSPDNTRDQSSQEQPVQNEQSNSNVSSDNTSESESSGNEDTAEVLPHE